MKKFLALLVVSCAMFAAKAAYVKWDIVGAETVEGFGYASLAVYVADADNYTILKSYDYGTTLATQFDSNWEKGDDAQAVYLSSAADYANQIFVAVIFDSEGQQIGYSNTTVSGSELSLYVMDDTVGGIPGFNKSPMSFGVGDVVPEPTSGLMLALGLAMLGLKRKQV